MNIKRVEKLITNLDFYNAYIEIFENKNSFKFEELSQNFPKIDSQKMYMFLMYAISKNEDAEKHLAICYYLYFIDPYILGADSLIRWHLIQALRISPNNKDVLQWIFAVYNGNPDCPFSESELVDYKKRLENL